MFKWKTVHRVPNTREGWAGQDNEQIGRHEVKTADERVREDERG